MARRLAGILVVFLPLALGACGDGAGDPEFTVSALAAPGGTCRCVREIDRDGELVAVLIPTGCIASTDPLPICTVAQPRPGSPRQHTP